MAVAEHRHAVVPPHRHPEYQGEVRSQPDSISVSSDAAPLIANHAAADDPHPGYLKEVALDDLTDVNAPTPTDGDVVTWDDTEGEWVAAAPAGGALALDDLTDVDTTGVSDGEMLAYDDGTATWVVVPAPTASIAGVTFPIVVVFDAGDSAITGNPEVDVVCVAAGSLTGWTMMTSPAGSAVVDVWKDTGGNFPPTDADSITDGHEPAVSADDYATDADLSDWSDVTLSAGDVLRFHLDSSATVKRVALTLTYTRS
jgi:hypothetical protein